MAPRTAARSEFAEPATRTVSKWLLPMSTTPPTTTRDRIITEAMRLFADRGYKGTSVAAIEEAAGLSPGSGGLYKHFRSKEDVLKAGIELQLQRMEEVREAAEALEPGTAPDPAAGLRLAGQAALAGMAAHRDFNRILFRELDRFPDILADVRERAIHSTYRSSADAIRRQSKEWSVDERIDPEAVAVLTVAPLLYYRIVELLFGEPPGEVAEDRVLDAWVDLWTTYISAKRERKQ